MRKSKKRRWIALLGVPLLVGAAWVSVSLAADGGSSKPGSGADARAVACQPTNPQPAAPLEMNTVQVNDLAKTVAMEKELFSCQDQAAGSSFSRDVETFVELIEQASATNVRTVARRVQIATCDKNFAPTGAVKCRATDIPLGPPIPNPLEGCQPPAPGSVVQTPPDPVEMNSVAILDFIKTIKVEKEVLNCHGAIGDVYLFTEVIERKTAATQGYAPFATRFEGIICRKDPQRGVITGCNRFTT